MDQRIGQYEVPNHRCHYQEPTGRRKRNDERRMKPVQPLTLIERYIKKRGTEACVEKAPPIRGRMPWLGLWARLPRNAEVDQDDHQRSQNSPVPKDPSPGKVIYKERLPGLRHIRRKNNVRRI